MFGTGEFSWDQQRLVAVRRGIAGGDYNALSLGIGRDLMALGRCRSMPRSRVRLPQDGTLTGGSYRLSYSKNFDEYDSQVTFAGYRFSQEDFMSMGDYLDARYEGGAAARAGDVHHHLQQTVPRSGAEHLSQLQPPNLLGSGAERSLQPDGVALLRHRRFQERQRVAVGLSQPLQRAQRRRDVSVAVAAWGSAGTLSYNMTLDREENAHRVGYYNRVDEHNNYQISAGAARSGRRPAVITAIRAIWRRSTPTPATRPAATAPSALARRAA
ncbi:fimbria/pilus outer membrane usher protein [Serratia ureilytica]